MEYENSKNSYLQNLQAVIIQKQNVQLAEKIYAKSMTKFREGVGSTLEITQAETEMRMANNYYLNALYDLVNSKIDLKNAIGQSVQP
jgi:outer membrane protein TolC